MRPVYESEGKLQIDPPGSEVFSLDAAGAGVGVIAIRVLAAGALALYRAEDYRRAGLPMLPVTRGDRETARQIGIVAHRLLRQCAEEGLGRWTPERIAAQRTRVVSDLGGLGFTGIEAGSAADRVLTAVTSALGDARGRWLFDPRHADAHSEYALTGIRDGVPVHVVLDRSFIDDNGIRWIVDFKLSQHQGAGRDAFLDSEQTRYRQQLETYAEVLRGLGPQPIRLGLYFPLLLGWREWEAPH